MPIRTMVLRRVIVSQELPAGFFACFYPATEHFADFLEHLLKSVEFCGRYRDEKQKFENIQNRTFQSFTEVIALGFGK